MFLLTEFTTFEYILKDMLKESTISRSYLTINQPKCKAGP